jgi:hypothetical protein
MKSSEFIFESAARELAKKLPGLAKHNHSAIDQLVKKVSRKHDITDDELHQMFKKLYKHSPLAWLKNNIKEQDDGLRNNHMPPGKNPLVKKFIDWCSKKLDLRVVPDIQFSYDNDEAQTGHHTGRHVEGSNKVWVYVKNRNLVDILRTVAHELRHIQQSEQGKIKPGSSYPFSPIEKDADVWAGGIIKIFGKQHPEIFQ